MTSDGSEASIDDLEIEEWFNEDSITQDSDAEKDELDPAEKYARVSCGWSEKRKIINLTIFVTR